MKVFLSWSGDKSRQVALALREWLPGVINSVVPFVSSKDIESGTRWQAEIAGELENTGYGIVCVTRDNQHAPWLNFEAGALAKAVESSRVVPLAIDLKLSDIETPLAQFQAQPASEEGLHEIVQSLNAVSKEPLAAELLDKAFEKWWPDLSDALVEIEQTTPAPAGDTRKDRELLEETLDIVRSLARNTQPVALLADLEGPRAWSHLWDDAARLRSDRPGLTVREQLYRVALREAMREAAAAAGEAPDSVQPEKADVSGEDERANR